MGKKIDLTGQRFGRLVVVGEAQEKIRRCITWECICDCGNIVIVNGSLLRSGGTISCGCMAHKNILGKRYGKLIVTRKTNKRKHGSVVWFCVCDCGGSIEASTEQLRVIDINSCGCIKLENIARVQLSSRSKLKHSDVPQPLVDARVMQMKINQELRRRSEQR